MEFRSNNINNSESGETITPSIGSIVGNVGETPNIEWSEEYKCFTVNGLLAVIPLSAVPPEIEESSTAELESSERGKYEELFFRLFKFSDGERYLLEMHEFKVNGKICHYQLILHKTSGQWKVEMHSVAPDNNRVVLPVLEDPSPPIFPKKYKLSLHDRLVGWRVIKKKTNGKDRKSFYHQGKRFRSFIEVTTFILYSNKPNDLQTNKTLQV